MMLLTTVSLVGILCACLGFVVFQKHILSLLIILEALMLSLLVFVYSMPGIPLFWFLVLLAFAACEAALGLSLLVSVLRLRGNDLSMYLTTY